MAGKAKRKSYLFRPAGKGAINADKTLDSGLCVYRTLETYAMFGHVRIERHDVNLFALGVNLQTCSLWLMAGYGVTCENFFFTYSEDEIGDSVKFSLRYRGRCRSGIASTSCLGKGRT